MHKYLWFPEVSNVRVSGVDGWVLLMAPGWRDVILLPR